MQYYKNRVTDELIMAERHDLGSTPGYYVYYQNYSEGLWYSEEYFNAVYKPYDSILGHPNDSSIQKVIKKIKKNSQKM